MTPEWEGCVSSGNARLTPAPLKVPAPHGRPAIRTRQLDPARSVRGAVSGLRGQEVPPAGRTLPHLHAGELRLAPWAIGPAEILRGGFGLGRPGGVLANRDLEFTPAVRLAAFEMVVLQSAWVAIR